MNTPPPPPPPPAGPTAYQPAMPTGPRVPGKRRAVGLTILITIVTCGIWMVVWSYQNGDELQRWRGQGLGGVVHLIIALFVTPVTMFLMASEVEQAYVEMGRKPPITTMHGLWFLLPIVGNIIWYVQIQEAINQYWTLHGQTNEPSL